VTQTLLSSPRRSKIDDNGYFSSRSVFFASSRYETSTIHLHLHRHCHRLLKTNLQKHATCSTLNDSWSFLGPALSRSLFPLSGVIFFEFTTSSYILHIDTNNMHALELSECRPLIWLTIALSSIVSHSCPKPMLLGHLVKEACPRRGSSKRGMYCVIWHARWILRNFFAYRRRTSIFHEKFRLSCLQGP
jgi:hypothetical protein